MIKAIIFDCFGVLVRDGWLPYKERYFGDDPELFEKATELNRMSNASLLTYDDFLKEIAALAGISPEQAHKEIEDNPPNTKLFEWIRDDLKPHYKIGLLSNASANWLDELFTPWQIGLFDEVVLSYQIGATKPDPAAYYAATDRLGVRPEECLFIDDQEHFCEGAKTLGVATICYQDNLQLLKEFQKYNIFIQKT